MIWTVSSFLLVVIGIALIIKWKDDFIHEGVLCIGMCSTAIGAIVFLGCIVMIICSHSGVDAKIHANRMEYEAIIKQVESIDSEYEDKSKVEVYQKVYDWNADVYSARYWAKSPWTNWFYSKKCVDSLKEIDLTDYEKEAR